MQLHQITIKNPNRPKKRVGRGGKRGTYSGHGGKGQTARSGRNFKPIVREILKRYPKLRGYKNHSVGFGAQTVDIKTIEAKFEKGGIVTPRALVEKNLVSRVSGKYPQIKILGNCELSKKLVIKNCQVSAQAKEKIEKVGGTIK